MVQETEQTSFTHFNAEGRAHMVDVSDKEDTVRIARAKATVSLNPSTYAAVKEGRMKKGDVLAVAQVAGIMGAKKCADLIPMCHVLLLSKIDLSFAWDDAHTQIHITATVCCKGPTGVEMEALQAVSTAALTIYDMCKALQRDIVIGPIYLEEKEGGRSGHYQKSKEVTSERRIAGFVQAINISETRGHIKKSVQKAHMIPQHGIEGDAHAGNWHRQISLLARESVETMQEKLETRLFDGVFAENITCRGIAVHTLPVGTILQIGEDVLLRVSQIGKECHNDGCAIKKTAGDCVMPRKGIFAEVLTEGWIEPGDPIYIR